MNVVIYINTQYIKLICMYLTQVLEKFLVSWLKKFRETIWWIRYSWKFNWICNWIQLFKIAWIDWFQLQCWIAIKWKPLGKKAGNPESDHTFFQTVRRTENILSESERTAWRPPCFWRFSVLAGSTLGWAKYKNSHQKLSSNILFVISTGVIQCTYCLQI